MTLFSSEQQLVPTPAVAGKVLVPTKKEKRRRRRRKREKEKKPPRSKVASFSDERVGG